MPSNPTSSPEQHRMITFDAIAPDGTLPTLTPADEGIVAAALDDARRLGLGDDASTDLVRDALMAEAGFSHAEASALAYRAVHAAGCA